MKAAKVTAVRMPDDHNLWWFFSGKEHLAEVYMPQHIETEKDAVDLFVNRIVGELDIKIPR